MLLNPDEVEAALREQGARQAERMADLDTQREQLYQRKVEIEAELQRLLDLYLRGTIPTAILDTKAAQKKEMLRVIEEAIAHNEQQRQAPITEDRIAALRAFTEELQRGIAQAEQDFTARRELVELMDVHVQLYWEGDELWLKLTSDLGAGVKRFVLMSLNTHQDKALRSPIRITGYRRFAKRWWK